MIIEPGFNNPKISGPHLLSRVFYFFISLDLFTQPVKRVSTGLYAIFLTKDFAIIKAYLPNPRNFFLPSKVVTAGLTCVFDIKQLYLLVFFVYFIKLNTGRVCRNGKGTGSQGKNCQPAKLFAASRNCVDCVSPYHLNTCHMRWFGFLSATPRLLSKEPSP